jgi:hypothetical protein
LARAGPPVPDLGLADYRKVIDTIFDTGRTWAATQAAMGGDWLPQSFLALAGAALVFIGRDIPALESAAANDWLFDLAAVVAKEHLTSYAPTDDALPAPSSRAVPDGILRALPIDHTSPAAPTVPATAESSQSDAEPMAGLSAKSSGAYADRPDIHATALEGTVVQLQEQLGTVGVPPPPPSRRDGIGRWLVSLGYWTDMADSVLSEITRFTYMNCNEAPDRCAQAVDNARSVISEILNRLPVDPTTTKDVTTLANWTAYLWSVMVQVLPLSMEACGLGHVLLAANDQMITTALPGALPRPSGIPEDPGLETLMVTLDTARSVLEPVVDGFLRQRPSARIADLLLDRLVALFKLLDRIYLPQSEGGQLVNLERIHNAVRPASIALSRLNDSAFSEDELSSIHKHLSRLLRVLDDILPINGSRDG